MKTILAVLVLVMLGCRSAREINVELISAQLIKIDTIYRDSNNPKQQLIWKDGNDIEYIAIVAMNKNYPLGLTISMLRQR